MTPSLKWVLVLSIVLPALGRDVRILPDGPKVFIRSAPAVPHYRSAVHDIYLGPQQRYPPQNYQVHIGPYRYYDPEQIMAIVKLTGNKGVEGVLRLEQPVPPSGPVRVFGNITGLAPGNHGFHVHQKGDITEGCGSTGSHYNPSKLNHGPRDVYARHAGDLGNIVADGNGIAHIDITDDVISLSGRYSVIGRAFVVHEKEDDLGRAGDEGSRTTGNAGGRLACGVIGLVE